MLIALIPDHLSTTALFIIIVLVLALDFILAALAVLLVILFVAFKAGKGILQMIDKTINWAVYTAFRYAEDALESPPLDKVPFLQLVLVGVKKAWDIFNALQGLILVVVNIAVTLAAFVLAVLFIVAMVVFNLAAVAVVLHYMV